MSGPGEPSPGDVQDIIRTRAAGEMQPVSPAEAATRVTLPAEAATRATAKDDPAATRASGLAEAVTAVPSDQRPTTEAITRDGLARASGSFTRLGRTRTNATLAPDTQRLDLQLQLSRPSVLADLGRVGTGVITAGVRKLIDTHGTEGRYAVDKPLAQGGMGAVLLIKDGDFQRPAAMKVMLSQYAKNPEAMERFLAEAQVTAQLEHPNIVPIHDLGIMEDGTIYFTMKYIEGESLGGVVKRLKSEDAAVAAKAKAEWDDERILLTFLKVLDGLSYAHAKGVVHRDLKPDNIMLGGHGEVLVVDWGIAKVLGRDEHGGTAGVVQLRDDDALSLTREGSAMGTLYYMPPEQARGELAAIDARSDIYALGATLYELLTLKRPISGKAVSDLIVKITNGELTPIQEARPGLPDDLAAMVSKALAFAPDRRYQTCSAFADDLRRYLAGQAVLARRRNLIERIGGWVARHKRQVAVGAGVVALIAVSTLGTAWYIRRDAETKRDAQVATARSAAAAGDWQKAYEAALAAGDTRREAVSIREQAKTELALAAKAREDAARSEANRASAVRLTAEARDAAGAGNWELARDKAKASLEAMPTPEAQEQLAQATAKLADKQRAERERLAGARKAEGDAALAAARKLDPLADADAFAKALSKAREAYAKSTADSIAIAGVDAAMAELGTLQANADTARKAAAQAEAARSETAKRRQQADEAIAAAEKALAAKDLDAANEQIAAARKLAPGDDRATALRDTIALALRNRDADRAAEAARAKARTTAAEALARAKTAEQAMIAATSERSTRQREADRLENELKTQPLERKAALVAARDAVRAANAAIAEQWALAEGAARSAADALASEPTHADAVAARSLLISLYRGRLVDARQNGALAEAAAFANLLRRLGVDVDAPETGTLAIDGPEVEVRRLNEDGNGRLVAADPVLLKTTAGKPTTLPQGRYELRGGDEIACVVIGSGSETRLTWAPAKRPSISGTRLRWVPASRGFWLAEDEVTQEQYAAFLADPAVFAEAKRAYDEMMEGNRHDIALLPREGVAPNDLDWFPNEVERKLASTALRPQAEPRMPVRGVSRLDAEAYCRWLSAKSGRTVRLPSAAERSFAATGGDRRRLYPWGPGFDFALASSALPAKAKPPIVGSSATDRGPFGHRDLAGSVREWITDPGLAHDGSMAGGSWTDDSAHVFRADYVESIPSNSAFSAIGFRILVEP